MVEVRIVSKATNEVEIIYLDYNVAGTVSEGLSALRKVCNRSESSSLVDISIKSVSNDTKKFFEGKVLNKGLELIDPASIYEGGYKLSEAMIDVITNECSNNENYCVHFYNTMKSEAIEENFVSGSDFDAFKDFIYTVMTKVIADMEDRLSSLSRISVDIKQLKLANEGDSE